MEYCVECYEDDFYDEEPETEEEMDLSYGEDHYYCSNVLNSKTLDQYKLDRVFNELMYE